MRDSVKGKKPVEMIQEGNNVRIKNNYGNVIVIDKKTFEQYKNNGPVNESLNKIFRSLEEDVKIDGFQILDQWNKELFEAKRIDFSGMRSKNELLLEDTKEKIETHAKLVLYRVVFAEDRKWAFVYHESIISAYITDPVFFQHLNEYRFGSGDCIDADLKIIQKLDEAVNTYINIDYEVTKVYSVKPREEQIRLDLKKDE